MTIDKIENRRFERNIWFFKWSAIITLLLAILKIIFFPEIFDGSGKAGDFFLLLLPISFYFNYKRTAKNWGGQFIEWAENSISFKTRNYASTIIETKEIKNIDIALDVIRIQTSEKEFEISIEDYTNYEDRIRIKDNFKQYGKGKLPHFE